MVIIKNTISAMIKIIILVMLIRKCRKSSITVNIKNNVTIHPCYVAGAGPYPTVFYQTMISELFFSRFSPFKYKSFFKYRF